MFNLHNQVVCPSEEPFAVYFHEKYKHKKQWTEPELHKFVDEFWLMAEKSLDLFFTSKKSLYEQLVKYKNDLNYKHLCDIIYLQFFEPKPKNEVSIILDKQIKYFFYLKTLLKIFPDAKFIILVRDPRVNAIRKKSRNLNAGQNPLYLAALWNNTYKNVAYLEQQHKSVFIIKYEDLVSDPETILQNTCAFLNIPYSANMLKTEGIYESFLNARQDNVDPEHMTYLRDFQSSLFGKVDKEKMHLQENEIDETLNNKIIKLTKPLLVKFNYASASTNTHVTFTLNDHWQILKSYLYRPCLIVFYLWIPLSVKLMIKKTRN